MSETETFDMSSWMAEKREGKVLFEHIGEFSSSSIDAMFPVMEDGLNKNVGLNKLKKRVFHIFVECVQNLYHHIEPVSFIREKYGTDRLGLIFLTKENETCRISTGNFIEQSKSKTIGDWINKLNSMSEKDIKEQYRKTLSNEKFTDKGCAGIGMIDMVRKSGNKLQCHFYPVDGHPDVVFFSFDVCVS